MGQSTNAILCYGFSVDDEHEWPEALCPDGCNFPELDEYILEKAGIVRPTGRGSRDDYYAAKSAALAAYPINLVPHCSLDYPMWFVALRRTVQEANRGYPKAVELPDIRQEERDALVAFCQEFGIELQEPKWLLASHIA